MLLSEIVYNIKNLLSGGIGSDDEVISDSQLVFIINYYRAKLLKQDLDKGKNSLDSYVQNLGKVDLIKADVNECCDIDACTLRTKDRLPKTVDSSQGSKFTFVGLLNHKPFQKYEFGAIYWSNANKWTGFDTKWYMQNNHIYIVNPSSPLLKYINIQGVFEKPEEAVKYRTCDCESNEEECVDTLDIEYPIPAHHIDTIVKLIASTELTILTSIPTDTTNDSINQLDALSQNK